MIKLEVLNTKMKGKTIKIFDGLRVGSDETCKVRAKLDTIEPVHAIFHVDEQNTKINVEAGSKEAHLYHNGRDVMSADLKHNDKIYVGPLKFRVINETMVSQMDLKIDELLSDYEESDEIYNFATEDLFFLCKKDPDLKRSISFKIPSTDRYIDQAQAFLSRLAHQAGLEEMKIDAFMHCTKELILNAHRHGHEYNPDNDKEIIIRYRDLGEELQLSIEDQGDGFDHSQLLEKVDEKDAASAARERYKAGGIGGLGFQMITKMTSDLFYNEKGNIVTFKVTKQL